MNGNAQRMNGRDWAILLFLSVLWGGSFFFIDVAVESVPPFTLVLARVAGFNTAVYGLPPQQHPLLFKTDQGVVVATTKLSDFIRARYAPAADFSPLITSA